MAPAADQSSPNPLDQLVSQYKQGYKTSEFWVALAAGTAQALVVALDPNKPLKGQVTNLTWIAIAYILSRSGLKVARAASQAKTVTALATAGAVQATGDAIAQAVQPQPVQQPAMPQPTMQQPPMLQPAAVVQQPLVQMQPAFQPQPMQQPAQPVQPLALAQPLAQAPQPTVGENGLAQWISQLRILIDLRDRGEITPEEFAMKRAELPQ